MRLGRWRRGDWDIFHASKVKQKALLLFFWCRFVTAPQDRRRSRRGSACSISNYLIPKGFLIKFLQFCYLYA
jgi:hypothetical protein